MRSLTTSEEARRQIANQSIDNLHVAKGGNRFGEQKLGLREVSDYDKKERQKNELKAAYLDQIEQKKNKKLLEKQRQWEEERRDEQKMRIDLENIDRKMYGPLKTRNQRDKPSQESYSVTEPEYEDSARPVSRPNYRLGSRQNNYDNTHYEISSRHKPSARSLSRQSNRYNDDYEVSSAGVMELQGLKNDIQNYGQMIKANVSSYEVSKLIMICAYSSIFTHRAFTNIFI